MILSLQSAKQSVTWFRHVVSFLVLVALCSLTTQNSFADGLVKNNLRLSATNSLLDSGVMKALLDDFTRHNPEIKIELSHAGALGVLKFGRDGKADVVISHHPPGEKRFIEQGYGRDRAQFMYSEFVLFGPPGELPELSKATDIVAALKILAEEEVEFLVPSARSGVFAVIEELWATAGINPNWVGYESTGISGASNLLQAADMGAYTIMDYGTYIVNREQYGDKISPIFRGDLALRNIYSITIVNSEKVKGVNEGLAKIFYDYLIGEEGQGVIGRYGEEELHVSFLTPAANFDTGLREKRAQDSARHYKQQSEMMRALFIVAIIFLTMTILLFLGKKRAEKKQHVSEEKAQMFKIDRDSAQHANDIKSLFLANMSHEIRTPLNAIIGYSQLLEEEIADVGNFGFVKDLKYIDKAAHHLLALINDVLDLSKIEAGMMNINFDRVDVRDLAERLCITLQPLAKERGNKLLCNVASDVDELYIDEIRLAQILMNLLSNACKFTKEGTVTLSVRHDYNHIQNMCIFEVSDTGIGMAIKNQEKVFDAFVQADNTTTRKYGGTGLGLAISKRFCELMHGEIYLKSDIGKGSTFTVKLPFNVEELKAAS